MFPLWLPACGAAGSVFSHRCVRRASPLLPQADGAVVEGRSGEPRDAIFASRCCRLRSLASAADIDTPHIQCLLVRATVDVEHYVPDTSLNEDPSVGPPRPLMPLHCGQRLGQARAGLSGYVWSPSGQRSHVPGGHRPLSRVQCSLIFCFHLAMMSWTSGRAPIKRRRISKHCRHRRH